MGEKQRKEKKRRENREKRKEAETRFRRYAVGSSRTVASAAPGGDDAPPSLTRQRSLDSQVLKKKGKHIFLEIFLQLHLRDKIFRNK